MMKVNLDSRGKKFRIFVGANLEGIGLLLLVLWYVGTLPAWAAIVGATLAVAGLTMVFEGVVGWCAIRAMGLKTSI